MVISKTILVSSLFSSVYSNNPGMFVVTLYIYLFALIMHDGISSAAGSVGDEVSSLFIHFRCFLSLVKPSPLMVVSCLFIGGMR